MEILLMGFLTALACFIIMARINLEFFAKYHWQSDLGLSGLLAFLFFGSFSGMLTAAIAGLFLSIFLTITRRVTGLCYE